MHGEELRKERDRAAAHPSSPLRPSRSGAPRTGSRVGAGQGSEAEGPVVDLGTVGSITALPAPRDMASDVNTGDAHCQVPPAGTRALPSVPQQQAGRRLPVRPPHTQ